MACTHFCEDELLANINSFNNFKNAISKWIQSIYAVKTINNYFCITTVYNTEQRSIIQIQLFVRQGSLFGDTGS